MFNFQETNQSPSLCVIECQRVNSQTYVERHAKNAIWNNKEKWMSSFYLMASWTTRQAETWWEKTWRNIDSYSPGNPVKKKGGVSFFLFFFMAHFPVSSSFSISEEEGGAIFCVTFWRSSKRKHFAAHLARCVVRGASLRVLLKNKSNILRVFQRRDSIQFWLFWISNWPASIHLIIRPACDQGNDHFFVWILTERAVRSIHHSD